MLTLEEICHPQPSELPKSGGTLADVGRPTAPSGQVGTRAFVASFDEFLETRFKWWLERAVEKALRATTLWDVAAQRAMGDLDVLDEYELLVTTQKSISGGRPPFTTSQCGGNGKPMVWLQLRFASFSTSAPLSDLKSLTVTIFKDSKSRMRLPFMRSFK